MIDMPWWWHVTVTGRNHAAAVLMRPSCAHHSAHPSLSTPCTCLMSEYTGYLKVAGLQIADGGMPCESRMQKLQFCCTVLACICASLANHHNPTTHETVQKRFSASVCHTCCAPQRSGPPRHRSRQTAPLTATAQASLSLLCSTGKHLI